ncbi:MAG: EAL domain-containing protein [Scytolyngbya sp. HA4215-MV1]|jgi:diguanylate cyclase (GGDEF)-like protein|nr:EAL domain-containing protein [Scytolyngbya sp. HA4215-MV1]
MKMPAILIVDDEPDNFDVIETLLSDHLTDSVSHPIGNPINHQDYQLHYAFDGQKAIDALDTIQPDLILLDVMMPGLDGIEVCRRIKAMPEWQAVPIIMVTALSTKADLARCLEAGANDFVSKPVNRIELRARVHSMLRIKQQYDELQAAAKQQAALEAEKVLWLTQHNSELEAKVAERTAQLQAQTQLIQHNALHDPLTDLPNRTLLLEQIAQKIDRVNDSDKKQYAVLFLDLARFKVINDSLGHIFGDRVLTIIAQKLKKHLQITDLVSRFGGDEFVILLENITDAAEAIQIAENILADFQNPLLLNGYQLFIGVSIGIVLGNESYQEPADLIRDADIAMYRAKRKGENTYQVFDAAMHTQALHRLTLESDLRQALERQEFIVYYQPIIDILNDRLIGFEALVRWQHPTRGFVSPVEFVPIAEETGLIVPLDQWVFQSACQQLATWKNQFPREVPLKMSVNLSAQDLRKTSLVEEIDRVLKQAGLTGDSLTLEITESMLVEDINKTIELLNQLKARKIQISIDDFGTGYSSLNYLHRLPADFLKIDRSFVGQMQPDNRNYQVVSTIIALSNQLGLATVAEGIETQQQHQWLQQLGCELGQGYLFSKPLAAHEIEIHFLQNGGLDCK